MTTMPTPTPQPSGLLDAKGGLTQTGYRHIESLGKSARSNAESIATIAARPAPDIGAAISFVENRDYLIDIYSSVAYRIDEVGSLAASGSCVATIYINNVAMTGTSNTVSSTGEAQTPTAGNLVPAGSYVFIRITSNSACEYALIKCKCSYT